MKFCGKCHKMKVEKVTNPNNQYRFCRCDPNGGVLISGDVLSKMSSVASGTITRKGREERMRIVRKIEGDKVYE